MTSNKNEVRELRRDKSGCAITTFIDNCYSEELVIDRVYVYSLKANDATSMINITFMKLKDSQLGRVCKKFARNASPIVHKIANALDCDARDLPLLFNGKMILLTKEKADVINLKSNEVERTYIFDL